MYPTRRSGIPLRPTQAMARCGRGVGARLPGPGDTVAGVRPEALLGLLAEEERLRVYAAVVLGADTPMDVAFRTGLPLKEATKALHRLEQGGLVATESGRLAAQLEVFKDTLREYAPPAEPDVPLDPDRQKAAVLRTFIRDGRLQQIPMPWAKRRIVLEHMAAAFEPGVLPRGRGERDPTGLVRRLRRAAPVPRRRGADGPGGGRLLAHRRPGTDLRCSHCDGGCGDRRHG